MSYDAWKTSAPEADDAFEPRCCVCTGHPDAPPCSEDCDRIAFECRKQAEIKGLRFAAKQVLKMARAYAREGFDLDERVDVCLARVREYRAQIRTLRAA